MAKKNLRVCDSRYIGTDAERCLWRCLHRRGLLGYRFSRVYPIAGYFADFVCVPAKVVVELDSDQPLRAREGDSQRTRAIEAEGYRVLRFCDSDMVLRADTVLDVIWKELKARWTPPPEAFPCRIRERRHQAALGYVSRPA
jgi:very-short-patch-repair endonuclease